MSSRDITVDIDQLEELAKRVPSLNWNVFYGEVFGRAPGELVERRVPANKPEAEFIAAANPKTILNLIARLRMAEAELYQVGKRSLVGTTKGGTDQ